MSCCRSSSACRRLRGLNQDFAQQATKVREAFTIPARLDRLRRAYWDAGLLAKEIARLFEPQNRLFRRHVVRDYWRYLTRSIRPVHGQTALRTAAAVQWLLYAQKATPDDGVPVGFFPCGKWAGWMPSYPETTGYIITSLLAYADAVGDASVKDAAIRMARWEVATQMPS